MMGALRFPTILSWAVLAIAGCTTVLGIEDRELRPELAGADAGAPTETPATASGGGPASASGGNAGSSTEPTPTADPTNPPPAMPPPATECTVDADCPPDDACTDGRCEIVQCPPGFDDCNLDPGDGCETDLMTDPDSCGQCGVVCPDGCDQGACAQGGCAPPYTDCQGMCVDLSRDPEHCGQCFQPCAGMCVDYACTNGTCPNGFVDCGGYCADLNGDEANCGGCGFPCGGGETCSGGMCVAGCPNGFVDCGGYCADLNNDTGNCGSCGHACGGGETCSGAMCMPSCPGQTDCGGYCADLNNDNGNCGSCGYSCMATEICQGGTCQITACPAGYDDCDGSAVNGCETSLTTATDCGSCGNVCNPPNAMGSCAGGICTVSACSSGYDDCDQDPYTGCETLLGTDANCSACGDVCVAPTGGSASCVSGACQVTCEPGWGACTTGGCTPLDTNDNCGGCGIICAPAHAIGDCANSLCMVMACDTLYADCNGTPDDGCEIDTATDPSNCGGCNNVCVAPNATSACFAGNCGLTACTPGYADLDGNVANGCESICTPTGSEVCDGIDNDCDGQTDFDPTPCDVPSTSGLVYGGSSQCRQGLQTCSGPCQGYVGPSAEICDGIDNDCDGQVDDNLTDTGAACGTDVGACALGTMACVGGALTCIGGVAPIAEICNNNEDDDCNGVVDDC